MNVYPLIRKLLFLFNPERSHELSLQMLSLADKVGLLRLILFFLGINHQYKSGKHKSDKNSVDIMGLHFMHPIGLAAGLDKDGRYIHALEKCGFSFIEVGTVTPKAQPGNEKPRLFRLQADRAIINRMGFNNHGVNALVEQVKQYRQQRKNNHCLIGINIGKNKTTPLENAVDDYVVCLRQVYTYADYVTVNISSPNTPGLRTLQHGEGLRTLLTRLKNEQAILAGQKSHYVPLLVKIAPDLNDEDLTEMVQTFIDTGIDGIISGNTTSQRPPGLLVQNQANETGGLSGAPLTGLADEILLKLINLLQGKIPVIAVGGIMSAEDARRKLHSGASLVQIYTGFIYSGPSIISQSLDLINK